MNDTALNQTVKKFMKDELTDSDQLQDHSLVYAEDNLYT